MANPPCTQFSMARSNPKTPRDLREGMRLVKECLRIIWECQYACNGPSNQKSPLTFWAIENPAFGFLRWFLGRPVFEYCHSEYGEPFTKRTALWGMFKTPSRPLLANQLPPGSSLAGSKWLLSSVKTKEELMQVRSRCPIGFAEAFFEANP